MRLKTITIEGFRSIKEELVLPFDSKATIILGANDHGKTNILDAITFLNPEKEFDGENDLNWDRAEQEDKFPKIVFTLTFEKEEYARIDAASKQITFEESVAELIEESEEEIARARQALKHEAQEESRPAESSNPDSAKAKDSEEVSSSNSDDDPQSNESSTVSLSQADTNKLNQRIETFTRRKEILEGLYLASRQIPELEGIEALRNERESTEEEREISLKTLSAKEHQLKSGEQELAQAEKTGDAAKTKAATEKQNSAKAEFDRAKTVSEELGENLDKIERAISVLEEDKNSKILPEVKRNAAAHPLPKECKLARSGIDSKLEIFESDLAPELKEMIHKLLPRVEKIEPQSKVSNSVNAKQIEQEDSDFMRGIFYYAGLERDKWRKVFRQDDSTSKLLKDASERLNEALRKSWSQGGHLKFGLQHSATQPETIDLFIEDPTVSNRFVRATQRSAGFTQFFSLKTILYAREKESPASSYIWLFDEPGLFLHPQGQNDLIQVLETLASNNQIAYTTHSIFMLNKNFPARHRLVKRENSGTTLDKKPYTSKWKAAIDALGLGLPASILFSNKVLLSEGDSDPVYINAVLQKLIEIGEFEHDVNPLSIVSTGDSKNTHALIRFLLESPLEPQLFVLLDGDKGGRDREKALSKILKEREIPNKKLADGLTVEDYLIDGETLLPLAYGKYLEEVTEVKKDSFKKALEETPFNLREHGSLERWLQAVAKDKFSVGSISKMGVAREYTELLAGDEYRAIPKGKLKRAKEIANWIAENLNLTKQTLAQSEILEKGEGN